MSNSNDITEISKITEEIKNTPKDDDKKIFQSSDIDIDKKILLVSDLNSEECFNEIKISIDKKIVKRKNMDMYYKRINEKWNKCNINEAIEFMTELFSKYLVDLKNDFRTNQNHIQMIDKIIDKWKNGSINKYLIFKKLIDSLVITDIDLINEICEIKNSTKTEIVTKILKSYFDLYIIITGDKNDYILTSDFYSNFYTWCNEKQYDQYDTRLIGKVLKLMGIKNKHMNYGNRYMFITYKNKIKIKLK